MSLQYNKEIFEYARSICVVPFDTAEDLLECHCLMMEFQCIVQEKNHVSPLPLISRDDYLKLSILQYFVSNYAIAGFIQQQVYKVTKIQILFPGEQMLMCSFNFYFQFLLCEIPTEVSKSA